MVEQTSPFTQEQIRFGPVCFSSKGVFDTHKDKMVDPYAQTRIPKEVQIQGMKYWPQATGQFPCVLILHDQWGLTSQAKEIGAKLACEGYVVLLPNLYSRQGGMVTANTEVAEALAQRMNQELVLQDLNATCEFLNTNIPEDPLLEQTKRNYHAVIGFGIGGTLAISFACRRKRLRAAVSFYGNPPNPLDPIKNIYCPLLCHVAEKDDAKLHEEIQALRQVAKEEDKSVDILTYPGTTHGFFNNTQGKTYNEKASLQAWEETISFINKYLQV